VSLPWFLTLHSVNSVFEATAPEGSACLDFLFALYPLAITRRSPLSLNSAFRGPEKHFPPWHHLQIGHRVGGLPLQTLSFPPSTFPRWYFNFFNSRYGVKAALADELINRTILSAITRWPPHDSHQSVSSHSRNRLVPRFFLGPVLSSLFFFVERDPQR